MRKRLTARRFLSATLITALTVVSFRAQPVQAVSTSREIQTGKTEDKQITQQYAVVKDPLLNQWAAGIGKRLWAQTARKDVPYTLKILDVNDVNAFSTLGGYIYLDAGTLDFVQSDDELAGVIGHETGHIERRHGVTFPVKAEALNLLLGIASLLSPVVGGFGQAAEAGVLAEASRTQEVQADQYGLLLMSRAGYDPDAMVSFMNHLGAAEADNEDEVDKYLADHPGFSERVSRLAGYAELDPKKRTTDQILVQALHDQQTARYRIAATKFHAVLTREPNDAATLLHLGETQIALGLPHKAEQTLADAAALGAGKTREQALSESARLTDSLARFAPAHADVSALRETLNRAIERQTSVAAELAQRQDPGKERIKTLEARLRNISFDSPDLTNAAARPNTRAETVLKSVAEMGRSIDTAFNCSQESIDGVGSLEKKKESGLLKDGVAVLNEMQAPLTLETIPPQSLSVLPYYPSMLSDLDRSDDDMLHALDASLSAFTFLDAGLDDLNNFLRRLKQTHIDADMQKSDYAALLPAIVKASVSLSKAADAGSQARQYYNAARARQLQTSITLLGLDFPQERYATLQDALQKHVGNRGLTYDEMLRARLAPGEVAAASIIAADTNSSPQAVVQEARARRRSIIDVADARRMSTLSLEIFLGLTYLDYMDDPLKEATDAPNAAPTVAPPSITERS